LELSLHNRRQADHEILNPCVFLLRVAELSGILSRN
jgi:hypothetical protein